MTFQKRSVLSVFIEQASKYPGNVAIEDGDKFVTFEDLFNQVKTFSPLVYGHLSTVSLPPESRFVCVLLPQGTMFLKSVLSVFGGGGICVPMGIDATLAQLHFKLSDLGHPLLITQKNILEEKKLIYDNCLFLSEESEDFRNSCLDFSSLSSKFTFQENEFAFAYFTSGSTGQPKAVFIRHHAILHAVLMTQGKMSLTSDDKSSLFLNPAYSMTTQELWPVLLCGGCLVVTPLQLRHDIRNFRKWIKDAGISILTLVSSTAAEFFTQMTHLNEFSQKLRWLYCGGESLNVSPPDGLPFSIWFDYGSTETLGVTFNVLESDVRRSDVRRSHLSSSIISVGSALPGYDILIVSEALEILPDGIVGEVCISGEHIGSYVNRVELSGQKFINLCGKRAYRTGDVGYKNSEGILYLMDRLDNVVKLSGQKFEIGEIERILCQHSSIQKVVAVVQKNNGKPKIHVFYTLKEENASKDIRVQLFDFLHDKIPHYASPSSFTEIQTFPLNPNGKIDKQKLQDIISKIEKKKIEPLKTSNEKNLAEIWSKVLRIPTCEIGPDDNFFGLGGSSIQIGEILELIKISYHFSKDVELTPLKFFAYPTIRRFTLYMDHSKDGALKEEVTRIVNLSDEIGSYEKIVEEITVPKVKGQFNIVEDGVLLTGATGYLGSYLLLRLLEKYPFRAIYCLVRANSALDAKTRVFDNMKKFGFLPPVVSNCIFLNGDISRPFFDLEEQAYNQLCETMGEIFHAAAEVHFLKDYESLRASNVEGTMEILKFATQRRLKVLNYMSTLGIFGFIRKNTVDGVISENTVTRSSKTDLGYDETKYVAENIVLLGKKKGIPTRVFRLGIIGPHSIENIYNPNDFLVLFLQAAIFLKTFPKLDWKFPFATLDFAVDAILSLASTFEEVDLTTFHIYQKEVAFEEIGSSLVNGRHMVQLTSSEWMTSLLENAESNSQLRNLVQVLSIPFQGGLTFLQLPHQESWDFENKETLHAIRKRGTRHVSSVELTFQDIFDFLKLNL